MIIDRARNTLDVSDDASLDDINSAYRKRVKEVHPDQNEAPDAEEQFKEVREARETLLDDLKCDEKSREQSTSKKTKSGTVPPKDQSTAQSSNERTKDHKQNKERRKKWRKTRRKTTSTKTRTNTDSSTTKSRSRQRSSWQRTRRSTKSTRNRATDQSSNQQDNSTRQTESKSQQSKSQKRSTQQKQNNKSTDHNQSAQTENEEKQRRSRGRYTGFIHTDWRGKVRTWLDLPSKGLLFLLLEWFAVIKSDFSVYIRQLTSLKLSSTSLGFKQAKWLLKHLAFGFVYSIGVMILLLIFLIVIRGGLAIVVGSWLGDFVTLIIVLVVFIYLLAEPSVGLWLFGLLVVGTVSFDDTSYQLWFIISLSAFVVSIVNFIRYVGHGRDPWWQFRSNTEKANGVFIKGEIPDRVRTMLHSDYIEYQLLALELLDDKGPQTLEELQNEMRIDDELSSFLYRELFNNGHIIRSHRRKIGTRYSPAFEITSLGRSIVTTGRYEVIDGRKYV